MIKQPSGAGICYFVAALNALQLQHKPIPDEVNTTEKLKTVWKGNKTLFAGIGGGMMLAKETINKKFKTKYDYHATQLNRGAVTKNQGYCLGISKTKGGNHWVFVSDVSGKTITVTDQATEKEYTVTADSKGEIVGKELKKGEKVFATVNFVGKIY